VRLVLLVRECGDHDGSQQPDDDEHHQELDQRDSALLSKKARPQPF
jgi:hypothetical protein